MKKIIVLLVSILLLGCQPKSADYEYVVKNLFSTENIAYLHDEDDMTIPGSNEKMSKEFDKVYEGYVTENCLNTLKAELSVEQMIAFSNGLKMSVVDVQVERKENNATIKCNVEVDGQKVEVLLTGQEEDGKVSSLKIVNAAKLEEIINK